MSGHRIVSNKKGNKFALLSTELLDYLKTAKQEKTLTEDPVFTKTKKLDDEIKRILYSENLTPSQKANLYTEKSRAFLKMRSKYLAGQPDARPLLSPKHKLAGTAPPSPPRTPAAAEMPDDAAARRRLEEDLAFSPLSAVGSASGVTMRRRGRHYRQPLRSQSSLADYYRLTESPSSWVHGHREPAAEVLDREQQEDDDEVDVQDDDDEMMWEDAHGVDDEDEQIWDHTADIGAPPLPQWEPHRESQAARPSTYRGHAQAASSADLPQASATSAVAGTPMQQQQQQQHYPSILKAFDGDHEEFIRKRYKGRDKNLRMVKIMEYLDKHPHLITMHPETGRTVIKGEETKSLNFLDFIDRITLQKPRQDETPAESDPEMLRALSALGETELPAYLLPNPKYHHLMSNQTGSGNWKTSWLEY